MTKKKRRVNSHQIHGLVVFKNNTIKEDRVQARKNNLKDINQENKIKLLHEIIPFGAMYRYSIILANQSLAPITEIKLRIKIPAFISLVRYSPLSIKVKVSETDEKEIKRINLKSDKLNEESNQQFNFYFTPTTINNQGEISTSVSFIDNKDFIRVINSEPIELVIVPINIEKKTIYSSEIGKFLKTDGIRKAIKSFGIGVKGRKDGEKHFNQIIKILENNNFQLIAEDKEKKISWYFGIETNSKEDILVIGQIVSDKLEFIAASHNNSVLISLLTKLSYDFKNSMLNIIDSIDNIYNLECKFCSNVLHYFPEKGMPIKCIKCNKEQVIW
ncbi:MAG: hypothetical protein ACFFAN_20535 [Promethearchaeota archaeon]